jgi:UDPglucose--hexose-1-phosphate uridylyltransferase
MKMNGVGIHEVIIESPEHDKVIALPVIPKSIHERMETAREHFDAEGSCIYCDAIKMEKAEGERITVETDNYVAFVPYASRMPFETWVLPKFHNSNFEEITTQQCSELARIMKGALGKLYRAVGNPDFNYAIYSAPCRERNIESYHWHIKIFPRIASLAGFEVGSGVAINTVVPENAAKYLREG